MDELVEQFMRLGGLMHRFHVQRVKSHGPFGDPHQGQGRVLSILRMQAEIEQKELSYLLDMSKQSLTELLGKLERNGYITRTQSEKDRRAYVIKLTDEGAAASASAPPHDRQEGIERGFTCLTDDEQRSLSDYLGRIIVELEAMQAESGPGDDNAFDERMRQEFFANHAGGPWQRRSRSGDLPDRPGHRHDGARAPHRGDHPGDDHGGKK